MTKTKVWIVEREVEMGLLWGNEDRDLDILGRQLAVDTQGRLRFVYDGELSSHDRYGCGPVEIVG